MSIPEYQATYDTYRVMRKSLKEFNTAFGLDHNSMPAPISMKDTLLRQQLFSEEYSELLLAVGAGDLVGIADALTDLDYVTIGTFAIAGVVPDYEVAAAGNQDSRALKLTKMLTPIPSGLALLTVYANQLSLISHSFFNALAANLYPTATDKVYPLAHHQGLSDHLSTLLHLNLQLWKVYGLSECRLACFNEVHRSNMSKLDSNGKAILNEAGRVVKSENYSPPDLAKIVNNRVKDSRVGSPGSGAGN